MGRESFGGGRDAGGRRVWKQVKGGLGRRERGEEREEGEEGRGRVWFGIEDEMHAGGSLERDRDRHGEMVARRDVEIGVEVDGHAENLVQASGVVRGSAMGRGCEIGGGRKGLRIGNDSRDAPKT